MGAAFRATASVSLYTVSCLVCDSTTAKKAENHTNVNGSERHPFRTSRFHLRYFTNLLISTLRNASGSAPRRREAKATGSLSVPRSIACRNCSMSNLPSESVSTRLSTWSMSLLAFSCCCSSCADSSPISGSEARALPRASRIPAAVIFPLRAVSMILKSSSISPLVTLATFLQSILLYQSVFKIMVVEPWSTFAPVGPVLGDAGPSDRPSPWSDTGTTCDSFSTWAAAIPATNALANDFTSGPHPLTSRRHVQSM
mmetsp:Transcript_70663/g.133321  ORF Transcript_70663/g.133321 Transcript_70663/m.133321 type:complete len:256 (+) Transcript_70663:3371-4138(+)